MWGPHLEIWFKRSWKLGLYFLLSSSLKQGLSLETSLNLSGWQQLTTLLGVGVTNPAVVTSKSRMFATFCYTIFTFGKKRLIELALNFQTQVGFLLIYRF